MDGRGGRTQTEGPWNPNAQSLSSIAWSRYVCDAATLSVDVQSLILVVCRTPEAAYTLAASVPTYLCRAASRPDDTKHHAELLLSKVL